MPQTFRLASWNIARGVKFDKIVSILREEIPADIYALQEVERHTYRSGYRDAAADLSSALDMHYAYGVEYRELAQEGYGLRHALHGQAFFSNVPIMGSRTFYLPHQIHDWSPRWFHKPLLLAKIPRLQAKLIRNIGSIELGFAVARLFQPREGGRMAQIGEFNIRGRKLFIYNTHLEWHASDRERALQMRDILQDAGSRIDEKDAVIILGDFNTELGESSLVIQAAQKHGFCDALLNFDNCHVATCSNGQRMDWILTKNLKTINGSVFLDAYEASDHRPIIVELEFI